MFALPGLVEAGRGFLVGSAHVWTPLLLVDGFISVYLISCTEFRFRNFLDFCTRQHGTLKRLVNLSQARLSRARDSLCVVIYLHCCFVGAPKPNQRAFHSPGDSPPLYASPKKQLPRRAELFSSVRHAVCK